MYIRRVVVKGFRNLRCLDVGITPGMTCVVGENNSGKTKFLFSLRLALDANLPNYCRTLVAEDFSEGTDISSPSQVFVGIELTDFYDEEADEKVKELALAQEWAVEENVARICYPLRGRPLNHKSVMEQTSRWTNTNTSWSAVLSLMMTAISKT